MTKHKNFSWTTGSRKIVLFVLLLIAVVAAVGIVSVVRAPGKNAAGVPANNTVTTKKGRVVCLPHKNAGDGPQTMECAIGLQSEDTKYYALKDDSSPDHSLLSGVTNKQVEVNGMFAQTNDAVYDTVGAITISKLKVLE